MKQSPMYRYLGSNGVITTPIKLDGIYSIQLARLDAEPGKILVNLIDHREREFTICSLEEVKNWTERDK